jgi:glycosyltransferase involved in cell wall biosynthesis
MALGTPCVLKADSLGEMSGAFFERGLQQLGLSTRSWPFRAFLALRNRLLRQGSRFVSISRPVETELLEAGVEPAAIARIPNGVDVDRFRPADLDEKQRLRERFGIPPGASAVIFTGRLVVYKGLAGLLRAWGAIRQRHPDALLLIVGSGGLDLDNCEQELKDQARDDELGDSVRFVGAVERVEDYLRAADIFVFPTEEEAFGISLVEAMACELPVVSTPAGGLAEILARSDFGLTVEAGSDAALGDAGRRIAERDYSLGAVVDRYVDLFESAPDPGGPHRALPSDGLGGSTR